MYLTDPTLYGVNLPQREFPVPTPFFGPFAGQNLPTIPWQNFPVQTIPWQNFPVQTIPWQGFQRFVPPMFQYGLPPFFNQAHGMTPPFMTAPMNPMAFNPYVHAYGWQRPWMY